MYLLNISIIIIHFGFFERFLCSYLNTETSMKRDVISCKRRKRLTKSMSEGSDELVHCTVIMNSAGDCTSVNIIYNIIIVHIIIIILCVCVFDLGKKMFQILINYIII